jgi:hypothetical protein
MAKPMTEQQRARWERVRRRGWYRYVFIQRVLFFALPLCASLLLFRYLEHSFGHGQWYGWQSELLMDIPLWTFVGIIIGSVEWRTAERSYALPPLAAEDSLKSLQRTVARTRGFALFCLAGLLFTLSILFRGCSKT